jgi:hypothetical protein
MSGPSEHNENRHDVKVGLSSQQQGEAETLSVPQALKESSSDPQALLVSALHGPIGYAEEGLLSSALSNDSVLAATLEERALLACVGGVGTVESETEAKILQQLMSSSPNLTALAIGMRVIVEPHPEYYLSQRVALNYTSFLPGPLAKEILNMAVEKGVTRDSWYRDAFDDSKKLEFAMECKRMTSTLLPDASLPRFERSSYLDVVKVIKNIDALCEEGISDTDMHERLQGILELEDKELKAAAFTLLLFTGNEQLVTGANELLLSEYPRLRGLLGSD